MKKIIVLLLIISLIPTAALAGAEVFREDMESYSESAQPVTVTIEDNTSKQLDSTYWWLMKGKSGNPLSAGSGKFPELSIVNQNGNNMLAMTGGSGDYSSYVERRQAARYMGSGLQAMPNAYKIDFDFEKFQTRAGLCFQFMIHNDGKNYYAVNISGEKNGGAPLWTVAKIVNNAVDSENVVHSDVFCTNPTASGGGSFTGRGHVSVVSDGEGVITVSITGKRFSAGDYSETLTLTDSEPFDTDACNTTVGFFAGVTQSQSAIDNITVSEVSKYIDYEPGTVLYRDVSQKAVLSEFGECNIRRIYFPSLAGKTAEVIFKSDSGDVSVNALFDSDGMWINLENQSPCTAIVMPDGYEDYSELKIFAETENADGVTLSVKKSDTPYFPRIKGRFNNDDYIWTSSDEAIVSVNGGEVTGVRAGKATVTAQYRGASLSFDVTVKGEYDFAAETGRLDEYFAEKKPVFDEINAAIAAKDAPRLKDVLTNAGDIKIETVLDINLDALESKTSEEIDEICNNLVNYSGFPFTGLDDYAKFENTVSLEADVIKLENVSDESVIENITDNENGLLKLDTDNKFFVRFKQKCISNMLNKKYDNFEALNKFFSENIVMTSYGEMIAYTDIGDLMDSSADIIGYNVSHYNSEKCEDMYTKLLGLKSTVTDVDGIQDFADSYKKPAQTDTKPDSGRGGSSGGSRGSSSFTADASYVKAAEENVNSGVSKENEVIYYDVEKGAWYEQYVLKLAGKNIMNGNGGYIKPGDLISRAEFAKMLILSAGIPIAENDTCGFADVAADAWYYKYVSCGSTNQIITGSGNMFNPNAYITREEIAVLTDRVINFLGLNVKLADNFNVYADNANISQWAYSAVARCSSYGIIGGYSDNTFAPQGNATRAESAKMLSCLIDIIKAASAAE